MYVYMYSCFGLVFKINYRENIVYFNFETIILQNKDNNSRNFPLLGNGILVRIFKCI